MPSAMWAGDLDLDGLLDLIIEESWHYNLSQPALWLSPAAEEGQALGRVTGLASVGC
ncbi:MAG: hypothetical protein KDA24_28875 [Deltaproteobacteria bacterium]|nr:hypothetical protein [Deltaproteobacteria bacterium]